MKSTDETLELLKSITSSKGACPPALLFVAPDLIRKQRFCDLLVQKYAPNTEKGKNPAVFRFDAKGLDQRQLVGLKDEISALSLFSSFRLFLIHNVDELSSALTADFLDIFKGELQGVSCVCLASALPANSVMLKFFRGKKTAIVLEPLEGPELTRWIQKELKIQGVEKFEPAVVDLLANVGEFSPDKISQVISHAALFVDSGSLGVNEVRALFSENLDASEFDFLDALMQRNEMRSQSLLQVILAAGKNPFMLLSLLQRNLSTYLAVASLLKEGKSPGEVGSILKIPPWLLKKHLAAVQKYSLPQLQVALNALLLADSKLKNRSLGTESIFSEFVYNVTHGM